ncbi:hypothetical protein ACFE04_022119 [Oxalis oulophora]
MAVSYLYMLIFLYFSTHFGAKSQSTTNETDFSCSENSQPSCETYIAYYAQSPKFLDLGNISDLFGASRLSIARASNLVSEETKLSPGQLLLIPVLCACNGEKYFSNATYQIKKGDNYYQVSITTFENLTNWQDVQAMNPSLNPNLLKVGVKVIFPLLCKCPSKTQLEKGIDYLITYVWQSTDNVFSVAAKLNASENDIVTENSNRNFSAAATHPVLIPVSQLPVLNQSIAIPARIRKSRHGQLVLVVTFSSAAILLFTVAGFLAFTYFFGKKRNLFTLYRSSSCLETSDLIQEKNSSKSERLEPKNIQDKLLPGVSGYLDKPTMYNIQMIMDATMNFDEHFKIGGSAYKADIDGKVLAVKKIEGDTFTDELKILQKVNHANLVKLMGFSSDFEGNRFLVYEYAENGSLDKWLYPKYSSSSNSTIFLSWGQRLQVALDVANGLHYLHEHTQPSIVHWDIRASNILLDCKFKAKISNFSLAAPAVNPTAPKVDVFAFGIVLLELLSGKKAMGTNKSGEIIMFWKEIRNVLEFEENRVESLRKLMDSNLEGCYPIDSALSLVNLARACTQEKSPARPCMAEVVFNLSVLVQGSYETLERSWTSGLESEELDSVTFPVMAR